MYRLFFFSSRRRHTRLVRDWSSDVCSSDLMTVTEETAVSIVEWGGIKYGFCAEYCHDLFMKHPEKFVETKTEEIDEKSSC